MCNEQTPYISMRVKGRSGEVIMGWPGDEWRPSVGETIETPFHPDSPFVVTDVVNSIAYEGYDPESDEEIDDERLSFSIEIVCEPKRLTKEV